MRLLKTKHNLFSTSLKAKRLLKNKVFNWRERIKSIALEGDAESRHEISSRETGAEGAETYSCDVIDR